MSQHTAQIICVILTVIGFLRMVYQDIEGRAEVKPTGFVGVLATIIVVALLVWLYSIAGLYSTL